MQSTILISALKTITDTKLLLERTLDRYREVLFATSFWVGEEAAWRELDDELSRMAEKVLKKRKDEGGKT
jgi:hypothetical protein